mmetsp:Transcript_2329/g.6453  ORF Transcript_2329/g.6453 Transcript_2329/m.6453 type:complete len:397 (-) Transcript_2329:1277-2467(-)
MAEQPIRGPLHRALARVERSVTLPFREAHGGEHHDRLLAVTCGWSSNLNPCPPDGIVEVRVFHVLEDPLHANLRRGVLHRDCRPLAPILTEAHAHQLIHDLLVRGHGGRLLFAWASLRQLLLPRLEPRAPVALQRDFVWNVHVDLHFARPPARVHVIPPEIHDQIRGERLEPNRSRGCRLPHHGRGVKVVQHLLLSKAVQAGLEGNVRNDFGFLRPFCFLQLQLLVLPLFVLPDLLQVRGLVEGNAECQHVVLPLLVHDLLALAALKPVLELEGEVGRSPFEGFGQEAAIRPLCPGHLLQEVLEEFDGILLPRGRKFGVAPTDQRLEHVRRHAQSAVALLFLLLPRHALGEYEGSRQLGHLHHQGALGLLAAGRRRRRRGLGGECIEDALGVSRVG